MKEAVGSLIAELGNNKQKAELENTETGSNGNRIIILDLQGCDLFVFVVNGHFVQIAFFALKKEEECPLNIRNDYF